MPARKREDDDDDVEHGEAPKRRGVVGRTSQACDRCKIRKIRCDARPGGCSSCLQNKSECKTTDRITGRANTRGHAETLENENALLRMHMAELHQQLRQNGLEPKPSPSRHLDYGSGQSFLDPEVLQQDSWADPEMPSAFTPVMRRGDRQGSLSALLPDFRPGCIGDNYLGVSTANNWLSPIEGTSLALFGMKLNLTEFLPPESDPAAADMSYEVFLLHSLGKGSRPPRPPLPDYEEYKVLADWYFKSVQIFIPFLHRPDFMKLMSAVYAGQYQPNTAETVMLHMVIMIMQFQFYCRMGGDEYRNKAMAHYHYSISMISDLIRGHTLQDLQALVLICSQLRNQPRPGAAWSFLNFVFGLVIESGLHRSASNWQGEAAEKDPHKIELRKRIFWSLLLLHVCVSGPLGRPMPIRLEDFDIEMPEIRPDNLPEDEITSPWRQCSFRTAPYGFRLVKILMKVYSNLYAIRPSSARLDMTVQSILQELDDVRRDLPAELTGGQDTVEEDRLPSLLLLLRDHSIRLILHHPSLCHSQSPQSMASNLDACLKACNGMLYAGTQLSHLKALDITWIQTTEYLAAVFTTLFVHTQRKDQLSSATIRQLRQDMDAWLAIMDVIGPALGAGSRLREGARYIIDQSLDNLQRHLAARTASAGLSATPSSPPRNSSTTPHHALPYIPREDYPRPYNERVQDSNDAQSRRQSTVARLPKVEHDQRHFNVPPAYIDPQISPMAPYASDNIVNIDPAWQSRNGVQSDTRPSIVHHHSGHHHPAPAPGSASMLAQSPQMQHDLHGTFASAFHPTTYHNGWHPTGSSADLPQPGPAAWHRFAENMMENIEGQDFMNSANALIPIDADKPPHMSMPAVDISSLVGLQMSDDTMQAWPLSLSLPPNHG